MEQEKVLSMQEAEASEGDKPPSIPMRPARPWRVAVIANVKGEGVLPIDAPADAGAEFDRRETIQAIQAAIESDGHTTQFLPADANLPIALGEFRPDMCFNIAEGIMGDGREAQVPALLEMLRIPYTASRVLANAVALDKTMTKRIWRDNGLPTASFQEFVSGSDPLDPALCVSRCLSNRPAKARGWAWMLVRSFITKRNSADVCVGWWKPTSSPPWWKNTSPGASSPWLCSVARMLPSMPAGLNSTDPMASTACRCRRLTTAAP